jgi:hypothetical protein
MSTTGPTDPTSTDDRGVFGQKHTPMCLLLDSPARKRGWPFICICRRDQPQPTTQPTKKETP